MTLPIPLSVRLSTARADKHIERDLRSLSFRSVAPGGFASAQFSLDRPLLSSPDELAYYGRVYIYDARSGQVVWEGRIEDPGRGVGDDGQIWELAAVGPSAHASDKVVPRIWIDRVVDDTRWRRSRYTTARSGRVDYSDLDTDSETPSIDLTFPEGFTLVANKRINIQYRTILDCGQELGRVRLSVKNGSSTANRFNAIAVRTGTSGAATITTQANWSSSATPTNLDCSRGGTDPIPAGSNVANIYVEIQVGGGTAGDVAYATFFDIAVRSVLKDINGNDITTAGYYNNTYVKAEEVIADLIGRGDLYLYDPTTSSIEAAGTALIDQLAFPLGVTPHDVFDELMNFEPGFYWAAWESQTNGKYRFEWRSWPSTVRYEADVVDGFNSPGSAEDLYNEALVAYTDTTGRDRTAKSTSTVKVLSDAGLTRTLAIDITTQANSAANAVRAGEQALLEHATPPNAGSLTVARPIFDHNLGRSVMPWEIRPGHLIRVRGVQPNINSLNASDRDGVTVFRVVAVDYDTGAAAATLELDSHPYTVARALADLQRGRRRRRKS